jgi:hypothetical protein
VPLPARRAGPEDALAGVPGTVVSPLRVDGDARQRLAQPQGPEYPGRIRTELDAGSDLPRGVRLLEQLGVDAPLPECESGGNSTDAATGDQDPEITPLMDFSVYPFDPWNLTGAAASCCELVHVQRQIQVCYGRSRPPDGNPDHARDVGCPASLSSAILARRRTL